MLLQCAQACAYSGSATMLNSLSCGLCTDIDNFLVVATLTIIAWIVAIIIHNFIAKRRKPNIYISYRLRTSRFRSKNECLI
jgi:purine-cytosine permease-like protein